MAEEMFTGAAKASLLPMAIFAHSKYLNFLTSTEADRRVAEMELLKAAVDYKEPWGPILAEGARNGTTGPEPVPHPDDVIIDDGKGGVRIDGPVMYEQKEAKNQLCQGRHAVSKKRPAKPRIEQDGQLGHPWDDKRSEFFFFHNGTTALRCAAG